MKTCTTLVCVAGLASAEMSFDGTVRFNGTAPFGGNNGGGEFDMTSIAGPRLFGQFQTFCVELNETISPGSTYNFNLITAAVNGGVDGGNPDPLDAKTAALYEAFATGSPALSFYDFDNNGDGGLSTTLNRKRTAEALQAAIWEIEQERTIEDTTGNQDVRDLANFYVDVLAQQLVDAGLGDRVRILNMFRTSDGGDSQDLLVRIPLPQAGALAAVGLAGLAIRRRR